MNTPDDTSCVNRLDDDGGTPVNLSTNDARLLDYKEYSTSNKRIKTMPAHSYPYRPSPTMLPSTFCKSMTYKKFQEQQLSGFDLQPATNNNTNNQSQCLVPKSNSFEVLHQCDVCLKVLSSRTNLRQHKLIHNNDKPFICKECGNGYTSAHGLRKHSLIHSGEKPHVCKICGLAFTDASNMRTHVLAHNKVKKFKCHLCEKSYTRLNMLKAHVLTHCGLNKFTCELCDKGFGTASNLKMHMNTHTREITHYCQVCNDTFTTAQRRDSHMLTHNESPNNKPNVCDTCGRGYMLSSGLKRHKREKHPDISTTEKSPADYSQTSVPLGNYSDDKQAMLNEYSAAPATPAMSEYNALTKVVWQKIYLEQVKRAMQQQPQVAKNVDLPREYSAPDEDEIRKFAKVPDHRIDEFTARVKEVVDDLSATSKCASNGIESATACKVDGSEHDDTTKQMKEIPAQHKEHKEVVEKYNPKIIEYSLGDDGVYEAKLSPDYRPRNGKLENLPAKIKVEPTSEAVANSDARCEVEEDRMLNDIKAEPVNDTDSVSSINEPHKDTTESPQSCQASNLP